jgi:hypothetical protein
MPRKSVPKAKPKLTGAERNKRFVEIAMKVEASESPEDFAWAFDMVAKKKPT